MLCTKVMELTVVLSCSLQTVNQDLFGALESLKFVSTTFMKWHKSSEKDYVISITNAKSNANDEADRIEDISLCDNIDCDDDDDDSISVWNGSGGVYTEATQLADNNAVVFAVP